MSSEKEGKLERRLANIHERINWMSDQEARAVWVKGFGAGGEFLEEKEKLLDETDKIISQLNKYRANDKS